MEDEGALTVFRHNPIGVGVAHQPDRIVARNRFIACELVAVGIIVIIGGQVIGVERQGHRLAFTGLNEVRLGESKQVDTGHLDAAFGIGGV